MKTLTRISGVLAAAALLFGCATIHQSGFPNSISNKGKRVTASLTHFNIFLLVPPTNLEKLMDDLSEQCGNNKVEGISWTDTRRWMIIGELVDVNVAGRCAE